MGTRKMFDNSDGGMLTECLNEYFKRAYISIRLYIVYYTLYNIIQGTNVM